VATGAGSRFTTRKWKQNAEMTAANKAVEEQTQREHGTTLRIGCIHLNV